jgi:DNA-binding beta-propeller fold protein YncE
MTSALPLALSYDVTPVPYPVRASVAGANPNSIDLQVLVTPAPTQAVTVSKITIEIPTGHPDVGGDISGSASLPAPSYDSSIPWTITSAGPLVTIEPTSGRPQSVTTTIVFTLSGIRVSETPGAVLVAVTEFPPAPGQKVTDPQAASIVKQPADYPISSFSADPPVLYDLDQTVTFHWTCTRQGQGDNYGLRIVSVGAEGHEAGAVVVATSPPLRDCVSDGICYSCQDGAKKNGVPYGPVNQTMTFALDVVRTDAPGHLSVVDTLPLTVQVLTPSVAPVSRIGVVSATGRLVRLHWLAYNASSCSIVVGSQTVFQGLPVDTYDVGYLVVVDRPPGEYAIQVVAKAISGAAEASHTLGSVTVGPIETIPLGTGALSLAVTSDGTTALVNTFGKILFVDLATHQLTGPIWAAPQDRPLSQTWWLALSRDNRLAYLPGSEGRVGVIDVPGRQWVGEIALLTGENVASAGALTPDGKLGILVTNVALLGTNWLTVVDLAAGLQRMFALGGGTYDHFSLALTPDGTQVLLTVDVNGAVTLLDVPGLIAHPNPIPVQAPTSIAITPDGALALVTSGQGSSVTVIQIASWTAESTTIPVVAEPTTIAISPDGKTAIVTTENDNGHEGVTFIDIPNRTAQSLSLSVLASSTPAAVIAPDGTAVIGDTIGNQLVLV